MLGMTPDDLFHLVVTDAMALRARVVESRECPYCGKPAWLKSRGPNGLKEFECVNSHLMIVAVGYRQEIA